MSAARHTIPAPPVIPVEDIQSRTLVAGVAITSFAALAISIALLGLGAGGVFAYVGKRWLAKFETRTLLTGLSLLNALTVPLVLEVILHLSVSLGLSWANFLQLSAMYLASAVPFFVTGLELALVFARQPRHISRLYG